MVQLAAIYRSVEITSRGTVQTAANGKPHIARRRRGGNLSGKAGETTELLNARDAHTATHYEAERLAIRPPCTAHIESQRLTRKINAGHAGKTFVAVRSSAWFGLVRVVVSANTRTEHGVQTLQSYAYQNENTKLETPRKRNPKKGCDPNPICSGRTHAPLP